MGDRCKGHCCRAFPLSRTLAELEASAKAELAGVTVFVDDAGQERCLIEDAALVVDMVIPLGRHRVSPSSGHEFAEEREMYTCRHLQPNGDCGIYERRPRVCSEYPYRDDRCDQPACEWDDGKAGGRYSAKLKLAPSAEIARAHDVGPEASRP
jgi:Fe-S-cluster containining protein